MSKLSSIQNVKRNNNSSRRPQFSITSNYTCSTMMIDISGSTYNMGTAPKEGLKKVKSTI